MKRRSCTQGALGHYFVDGQCSRCDAGHNKKVNYLDESGESKEATCYVISEITDSLTGTDEQPGWYVAEDDVTIDQRITINGNVHLVLADNSSLRVNGGITLVGENKLSIYAQSQGSNMGSLVADNVTEYCAGIGGEKDSAGGIINIAGGNVTACGGYQGSGIGGGLGGLGGTVTITGGNVTACGGYEGSGIGGGVGNHGGNVTITGGNVTANGGGEYGAGIGGGDYGSGGTVIISGGIVRVSNIGRGSYKAKTDGTFATQSESAPDGKAIIIAGSIGDGSGKESDWRGFIFDGDSGKVYGESFTFTQDFTIDGGKTLTIDSGKSLIIDSGSTFTVPYSAKIYNNGTCKVGGTVCNFSDTDMNATVENGGKIHQDINHDGICDKCNESDNCAIFNNVTVGSYEDFMQGSLNENITLTAPVTPNDENDTVTYKWYEKSEDGTYKSIWKATGSSYVVKKTTHGGKYEYRMEALCEGVVRWIPFVVEVACAEYENGFCTTCGAYQPASLTTDKHDVDGDDKCDAVYEIANAGQLYWFADKVNNYNGKFGSANAILMDNITVNTGDVAGCNGTKAEGWRDWTPIGNETYQYTGTFDGNHKTISGLYLSDTTTVHIGLFGYVGSGGKIRDVGVVDSYLNGKFTVSGVCAWNEGTITNCYNTGRINVNQYNAGGVCTYNKGIIENCYNAGEVSGTASDTGTVLAGSVCGADIQGTINNCYFLTGTSNAALGSNCNTVLEDVLEKNAEQFAGGEVAYLLQSVQTAEENQDIPEVWGQTLSGSSKQEYPVLGSAKVYKTIGCTAGYSNQENDTKGHDYDQNDVCQDCGVHKGVIENKAGEEGYPAEFQYSGTSVTVPTAANFTVNSGATPVFTWYKGDQTVVEDLAAAVDAKMKEAPVNAGTYTLVVTTDAVAGETDTENDYTAAELRVKVVVTAVDATVETPPTGVSGLVYDSGKNLTLIHDTEVRVTGGEIQYALGTADGTYSTSLPEVKDAGTYDVYYKVVGDDNHNDTKPVKITVKVDKAESSCTKPSGLTAGCGDTLSSVALPEGFVWTSENGLLEAGNEESGQTITKTAKYVPDDTTNYKEVTGIELTIKVEHKLSTKQLADSAAGAEQHALHCSTCAKDFHVALCSGGTATCKDKAVCSVCRQPYGILDPANHAGETEIKDMAEVTCTEKGYTGDTYCKDCGVKTKTGSEVAALGHDYTSTVTKEPTTDSEGRRTYTCSRCGHSYEESIPRLSPTPVVTGAPVNPTEPIVTGAPVNPTEPIVTGAPVNPTEPIVTGAPVNPTEPAVTGAPVNPTEPAVTGAPVKPTDPAVTGAPVNPTEPIVTGDPVNPTEPIVTGAPVNPTEPLVTGAPVSPTKPVVPTKPVSPTKPVVPTKPVSPTKPAATTKPVVPAKGTKLTDKKTKAVYTVTKAEKTRAEVTYTKLTDKNVTTLSIPETVTINGIKYKVTSIADNALQKNKKLTKVTIGSNVTTIGKKAFYKCTSLKTIKIGKNVTTIGANAFYGCSKLATVSMGAKVTTIGDKAFYKCTSLKKITIPAKVKKIGKQAFYGCKNLKTIVIETTKLTKNSVGSKAFQGIYSKADITVPKSKYIGYKKILKEKGVSSKAKIKKIE